MQVARKSIVTTKFLKKGEKIKANYLTFKRPGIGISPIDINKVIGKKLNRDLEANTVIHYKFLKKYQ